MSEINAAFLYSQLKISKKITNKRLSIWKKYYSVFLDLSNKIQIPDIPKYKKHNGHIFYIVLKKNNREKILKFLNKRKVNAIFHYIPLHSSPAAIKILKKINDLKNTNFIANNLIRLPLHNSITKSDIKTIQQAVADSLK